MRFISPKTDFAFKKIFGSDQSKPILISFLNALIYQGNPTSADLEIIDSSQSSGQSSELKDSYLDVKARRLKIKTQVIELKKSGFILRHIKQRFGNLDSTILNQIEQLSMEQLLDLGDALLDFNETDDLSNWLENLTI